MSFARAREGLSLLPNSAQLSLRLSLFTFPLLVPLIFMFAFFFLLRQCSRTFYSAADSAPFRLVCLPLSPISALFFFLLSLLMATEFFPVAHARMQEGHIVSRLLQKLASSRRVRSALVATSGSDGNIAVTSVRPFVECGQEGTTRATPGNSVGARHSVAGCLY